MNTSRAQALELLETLSEVHPEMRLGQLVCNVALWALGPTSSAVWDVEDEDFIRGAVTHLSYVEAKEDKKT